MADNSVSACMEQRVVMKFLAKEGVKPADIYRRTEHTALQKGLCPDGLEKEKEGTKVYTIVVCLLGCDAE